jgi:uncharacterized DUF497 family protein
MAGSAEEPEVDRLDWDEWNIEHIAKHGITREQVEQVIASGETIARESRKNRFLVLGPTREGQLLAVVFGPTPNEPGAFYTFSARTASRQERRFYHQQKGGGHE